MGVKRRLGRLIQLGKRRNRFGHHLSHVIRVVKARVSRDLIQVLPIAPRAIRRSDGALERLDDPCGVHKTSFTLDPRTHR